jgi:hypothetical protein
MRITATAEAAMEITVSRPDTAAILVRGCTVLIRASFTGRAGDTIDPESASVSITYPLHGEEVPATVPMEKVAGTWQAIWQSEVSGAGLVSYCIAATSGDDEGRTDGKIELTANGANPEPE